MLQGDDKTIITNIAKVIGVLFVIMFALIYVASQVGS